MPKRYVQRNATAEFLPHRRAVNTGMQDLEAIDGALAILEPGGSKAVKPSPTELRTADNDENAVVEPDTAWRVLQVGLRTGDDFMIEVGRTYFRMIGIPIESEPSMQGVVSPDAHAA